MSENNEQDLIEITVKPSVQRFYSDENNYGIYIVELSYDSKNLDLIQYDEFSREIALVGNMPKLITGSTYTAHVLQKKHPKFGLQYEAKTIYKKLLSTKAEQVIFLSTILTEKQAKTIINAYPEDDVIELIKSDKLDVKLLSGIGDATMKKIKHKILENEKYQIAIIELTGKFSIPYNAVVRMSKSYGSPELLLEKIKSNPYILTELDGFGFKRVDEIALSMGIEADSPERISSCLEYVIIEQAESNGHVWVKTSKVISEAIKLLGLRIAVVQSALNIIVEDEDNSIIRVDDKMFVERNLRYEYGIYGNLKRLLSETPVVSFNFDFENAVSTVEENQGFKFTEEQRSAILLGIEENVIVVNGKAGVGKTAVIKGIVEVLKMHQNSIDSEKKIEYEKHEKENNGANVFELNNMIEEMLYATCALSGKASQRIQESTGLKSYTIHRLLAYNPNLGWVFNESNRLPMDVIVLDEGSMVNSQLFFYLIRAIESGSKLIVTGDTAQLEPIGVGNVLVDLLKLKEIPSVELTIVHRQAQKSGILSCANMVREGVQFFNPEKTGLKKSRIGELQDLYLYPSKTKEKVFNNVINIAKKYTEDIMDFQVLTPTKNKNELSTLNLNNELQKIFNKDPEKVDAESKIVRKHNTLLIGDKVIINGNDYDKGVFNGTMGMIEHISNDGDGEIIIDFEGVGNIMFKKNELNNIDLGYAITIHKSQGSQWKYVVLAFDYSSYILLNRQLVYTGMTRASVALFFAVEYKALVYAIKTDKSSNRNTLLRYFFDGEPNLIKCAGNILNKNLIEEEAS